MPCSPFIRQPFLLLTGAQMISRVLILLAILYSAVVVHGAASLAVPATDFLRDIDGISLDLSNDHMCVLEQKHNEDEVGGEALCIGREDDSGKLQPPAKVTFVQVVTGNEYGCGITLEQTVTCWGAFSGMQVEGMYNQIVGADHYGCGIMSDNHINCWGHVPAKWPKEKGNMVQISCSDDHCCALDGNGVPTCWGSGPTKGPASIHMRPPIVAREVNEEGTVEEEDGYDEVEEDASDTVNVQFKQISVGSEFSCGITFADDLQCWGRKLHYGGISHKVQGPFKQISVGGAGVCALYGGASIDTEYSKSAKEEDTEDDYSDEELEMGDESSRKLTKTKTAEESKSNKSKSNSYVCWGPKAEALTLERLPAQEEWDQISVHIHSICAVSMNSELQCVGQYGDKKNQFQIPETLVVA
jgi:hypothetical protein